MQHMGIMKIQQHSQIQLKLHNGKELPFASSTNLKSLIKVFFAHTAQTRAITRRSAK